MKSLKKLLSRLKRNANPILPSPPKSDAWLHIDIYMEEDAAELTMKGGEEKVEAALSLLMLNHPKFYMMIKNSIVATESEKRRQILKREIERIANLN